MENEKPNEAEKLFLNIAYNRFYDIFDEVMADSFWKKRKGHRFSRIKDGFSVYSELLNYEPLKQVVNNLKILRPPMESEIGGNFFKVIRNIIIHFPFFDKWEDVCFSEKLINWNKPNQPIDKFFKKEKGINVIKYRFWQHSTKKMTYITIKFPTKYKSNSKIFLKDLLGEKEGVKFSFILMRQILDTQVVRKDETSDFVLMAQVLVPVKK